MAAGDQFVGVLVFQLAQVELTASGYAQGFRQQLRGIDMSKLFGAAQVPLTVGKQPVACLVHPAVMADGGEGIL